MYLGDAQGRIGTVMAFAAAPALQHGLPSLAPGHDGHACKALCTHLAHGAFCQSEDGHLRALTQRMQARVAKTADQHCAVARSGRIAHGALEGLDDGMACNAEAAFIGNVVRTKWGRAGMDVHLRQGEAQGVRQALRDAVGGIGVEHQYMGAIRHAYLLNSLWGANGCCAPTWHSSLG